jgi:hypothetical protein
MYSGEINPNHDVNPIMGCDIRYPTLDLERVTYKRPRKASNINLLRLPHHGTCKAYVLRDLLLKDLLVSEHIRL